MSRVKYDYLGEFVVNQFPIDKFNKMIVAYLNIVEAFQLMLADQDYYINFTQKFEMKIGSSKRPTNSKIESFLINKYDNKVKMEECILKYFVAFNNLNEMERKVFVETFIKNKKDIEILDKLGLYATLLNTIRKSAIVRFSLNLGFEHFIQYF